MICTICKKFTYSGYLHKCFGIVGQSILLQHVTVTFVFHLLWHSGPEFSNKRSELEGVFNQTKSYRFQCKSPIQCTYSKFYCRNWQFITRAVRALEQKIGELQVYMKFYASSNLRIWWYFSQLLIPTNQLAIY